MSAEGHVNDRMNEQDGLENLVSAEPKQIVSKAMKRLNTRQRAVLIMRCYDDMAYLEIVESLGFMPVILMVTLRALRLRRRCR